MEKGKLQVIPLGNGYAWFDTGSPDRLSDASDFVKAIELRQGVQIACLEEIAYRNEWISKETLLEYAEKISFSTAGEVNSYVQGLKTVGKKNKKKIADYMQRIEWFPEGVSVGVLDGKIVSRVLPNELDLLYGFQKLNGEKVICLNEGLEYLLKELKMQVTQVETNHEESTMSAETLKNLIEKMKNENIKIIVVDKDDNIKNAETLANETGAKIYKLDSGLTGETNDNAYIDKLEANFLVLDTMKK